MPFSVLPLRTAGAAENMAIDFLMLQRYPEDHYVRFRHYGWSRSAFTFGYSQKIAFVREQIPPDLAPELCRRATGGGVVDHREDWTYALVIPRGHPVEELRAADSYRLVHLALRDAMAELGQSAELNETPEPNASVIPTVCFTRAEVFDVIEPRTRRKIAGAAQKRNKKGILFQGSVARDIATEIKDWEELEHRFLLLLGRALGLAPEPRAWPDWPEEEVQGLIEQYSSLEWNEFR